MIRLAFYRGSGNWFDKITRWRTAGNFTHTEIVFSDGISFSSSQWDKGTRFKRIEYSDRSKWALIDVPLVNEADVRTWCESQIGKGYDWRGILKIFAAGTVKKDDAERWWCSECCRFPFALQGVFATLRHDCDPDQLCIAAATRFEALG
jgi:hypothetical protein